MAFTRSEPVRCKIVRTISEQGIERINTFNVSGNTVSYINHTVVEDKVRFSYIHGNIYRILKIL